MAHPTEDVAVPWYRSETILGILATVILGLAQRYGLLGNLTQSDLVQILILVVPAGVALYGRLTTTRPVVTLTKAKAQAINQSPQ